MIIKLIKWICSKFKCNSSCTYNIENEIFDTDILDTSLSTFDLKLKDIKRVCKILNKRHKSICSPCSPCNTIEPKVVYV